MSNLTSAQLQEALDKAPSNFRVTKGFIDARIKSVGYYQWPDSTSTICRIELDNGFSVLGHSACVDKTNFNPDVGNTIAYDRAYEQLWPLFGFMLAEARMAIKTQEQEENFLHAVGLQDGA